MSTRVSDLSRPRGASGGILSIHYDTEAFGRFSEGVARFLGTARFLVAQTVIVIIWIAVNLFAASLRWDPYPFILLNLAFSTQAAYAAPLILLAQNRQADRDREQAERDREVYARTLSDAEYLSRELAALRLAIADLPTERDLVREVGRLAGEIETLQRRLATSTDRTVPSS